MYEYALKYDTGDLQKINYWINLSVKHGLSINNQQLVSVQNKLKNFKNEILDFLKKITLKQLNGFLNDDFTNLHNLKKEVELARRKFIDDTFEEYLKARQMLSEHEEILKNRIKNITINSNINTGLKDLDNIINDAEDARFNNYKDSNSNKTGIIDIYNLALEKRKTLTKEIDDLISVELIRKTITRLGIQNPNDVHNALDINNIDNWAVTDIDIKSLRSQIERMESLRGNTKSNIQIKAENKLEEAINYRNIELNDAINKSKSDTSLAKDLNNSITIALNIGLLNTNTYIIEAKNGVNELKKRNLNRLVDVKMACLNNIGNNNNYSNWDKLNKKIFDTTNDLIPNNNIDIVTSKISLNKIFDDLKNSITQIKDVIDEQKILISKKNTEITVEMLEDSIKKLKEQKVTVVNKELIKIDINLDINIDTTIELVNVKKRNVFRRPINGIYYSYNNINILVNNGNLNENIFIENSSKGLLSLYFICSGNKHTMGSYFIRENDELKIRNKLFLSINDIVYLPTNEKFIINNIANDIHKFEGGSIILKARTNKEVLEFYVNYVCHEHNYQTNKKMSYANNMNGFLFPASNLNKKHNYSMNRRQIDTNIQRISTTGRQSRLQANTGSMSRLQRLKAKHL